MPRSPREALQSPVDQGADERRRYTFDFSGYGVPSSPFLTAWDVTTSPHQDVTSTALPSGTASIVGTIVVTPPIQALVAGRTYRLECRCDIGSERVELFTLIACTP